MATLINYSKGRCTFIHIPKTGGNSVTNWLQTYFYAQVTKGKQHATVAETKERFGRKIGWTFCVVRNPWDWAVSWYEFRLMLYRYYLELARSGKPRKGHTVESCRSHIERLESLGFTNWLKTAKLKTQHAWAKDVDIKLKLDNIEEDFMMIQEILKCRMPLPILNKNTQRQKNYRNYYSTYTRDLLKEKLSIDIETYGFEF